MKKSYLYCGLLAGLLGTASLFAAEVAEVTEVSNEAKNKLQEAFPNAQDDEQNKFFPGVGNIAIPAGQKGYALARINAYHKAFADARRAFQGYLESQIENSMKFAAGEPTEDEFKVEPAIMEEVMKSLKAKAAAAGVDVNDEAAFKEFIKGKVVNSSSFKQQVAVAGAGFQQGVMTYGCIIVNDSVACYAHYSPRNLALAKSLWTGESNSLSGAPGAKLKAQMPKTAAEWSNTFGARVRRDEKGRYCVIGFGHGVARSKSSASIRNASVKARLQAINEIKNFAGAELAFAEMQSVSESSAELQDGEKLAKMAENLEQTIEQKASTLKISGIKEIASKTIALPSGEIVVIAAFSWYPSPTAQKIYQDMQVGRANKNPGIEKRAAQQQGNVDAPAAQAPAPAAPAPVPQNQYRAVPTTGSSAAEDLN